MQAAFNAAVLPSGWKKITRTLEEDKFLHPAEGSDGSFHYLVFRDSTDNTYHQTKWSNRGNLEGVVDGSAMPIWGGQDANVIRGDQGDKDDDTIHGAGGNDDAILVFRAHVEYIGDELGHGAALGLIRICDRHHVSGLAHTRFEALG